MDSVQTSQVWIVIPFGRRKFGLLFRLDESSLSGKNFSSNESRSCIVDDPSFSAIFLYLNDFCFQGFLLFSGKSFLISKDSNEPKSMSN